MHSPLQSPLQPVMRSPLEFRRRGGGGLPSMLTPANQTILTVSAAHTLTASKNAEFFADDVSIGSGSPSFSWTPTVVDYDVSLRAGESDPITVVVAESNHFSEVLTGWNKTSVTVTGGESDPDGGMNAYKVTCAVNASAADHRIDKAASPSGAVADSGFEIWAEYNASMPVLRFYPLEGGAIHYCFIHLGTGETQGNYSSCKIVETRGNWKRVWFSTAQGGTITNVWVNLCPALGTSAAITNGTEYVRLYKPRSAEGVLPLTNYQRSQTRYIGVVNNLERWAFRSPLNDSWTYVNQDWYIDVLKPDAYDPGTQYPVIYVGMVEPFVNVYADPLNTIRTIGLHNTHNCIFATCQFRSSPWYGAKNDGTMRYDDLFSDVLTGLVDERYSTIRQRQGRMILGYSKSGWGGMSLLLKRPDVFGYVAAWDCPWDITYGTFDTATAFGSLAQFQQTNPRDIFDSYLTSVNDKARIVLAGSATWDADLLSFKSFLDARSIPYTYSRNVLGGGVSDHDWDTGWLPDVVADLMALRD